MKQAVNTLASSFCKMVATNSKITNAHARMGAWLIGAAEMTGGFPLNLTYTEIQGGFTRDGISVSGTGSRFETIRAAIEALKELGVLEVEEGDETVLGFHSKVFTMHEA